MEIRIYYEHSLGIAPEEFIVIASSQIIAAVPANAPRTLLPGRCGGAQRSALCRWRLVAPSIFVQRLELTCAPYQARSRSQAGPHRFVCRTDRLVKQLQDKY